MAVAGVNVFHMTPEQLDALQLCDAKMGVVQAQLDELDTEFQIAMAVVDEIRARIRLAKPLLVPLAEERVKIVRSMV